MSIGTKLYGFVEYPSCGYAEETETRELRRPSRTEQAQAPDTRRSSKTYIRALVIEHTHTDVHRVHWRSSCGTYCL